LVAVPVHLKQLAAQAVQVVLAAEVMDIPLVKLTAPILVLEQLDLRLLSRWRSSKYLSK
jgi:hypothetical protein